MATSEAQVRATLKYKAKAYKRIYSENHKRRNRRDLKYSYEYSMIVISDGASKSDERKGE